MPIRKSKSAKREKTTRPALIAIQKKRIMMVSSLQEPVKHLLKQVKRCKEF